MQSHSQILAPYKQPCLCQKGPATLLKVKQAPIWLHETIELCVQQLKTWDAENRAETPYSKFISVVEILKKKEGVKDYIVTVEYMLKTR